MHKQPLHASNTQEEWRQALKHAELCSVPVLTSAGLLKFPHRPVPVQAAHRARPDKHRKQARAFKELDTTLQVLGIDGGQGDKRGLRITASVHAPVQPEPVRTPRRQSSRASLAEEELRCQAAPGCPPWPSAACLLPVVTFPAPSSSTLCAPLVAVSWCFCGEGRPRGNEDKCRIHHSILHSSMCLCAA